MQFADPTVWERGVSGELCICDAARFAFAIGLSC